MIPIALMTSGRSTVSCIAGIVLLFGLTVGLRNAQAQTPAAPSNLRATSPAPGNIQLFWTNNAANVVGIIIEKKMGGGGYEEVAKVSDSATTWLDGGLTIGQSYMYRVRSYLYDTNKVSLTPKDITQTILFAMVQSVPSNEAGATVVAASDASLAGKVHYVRGGATGLNNGSDWTNAWTELPTALERGHIYYMGSGLYGQKNQGTSALHAFNDPENGNNFIFIKKAVQSNHGTNNGWNASYGTGQAVFESATIDKDIIHFYNGYYDIDGQMGRKDGAVEQHGFRFSFPSGSTMRSDIVCIVDITYSCKVKSFTNLRHCELRHRGCDNFVAGGTFSVANPTDSGGAGDRISVPDASVFHPSGTTLLKVTSTGTLPAGLIMGNGWSGEEYYARNMDKANNTIQLFPKLPFKPTGPLITGMNSGVGNHSFFYRVGGCGVGVNQATPQNTLLQHCYIHDTPVRPVGIFGVHSIIEYCYLSRNHSDSAVSHASAISTGNSPINHNHRIIRYNVMADIEGTAFIKSQDYWEVYGNIFLQTTHYPNPGQSGEDVGWGIMGGGGNPAKGWYNLVFNNTIYRVNHGRNRSASFTFLNGNQRGNLCFNNLWAECGGVGFTYPVVFGDYNFYYNNSGHPAGKGVNDTNAQNGTSDPFINSASYDFHLSANTAAGITLPAPYNKDMDGNVRGAGRTWSRGALQY